MNVTEKTYNDLVAKQNADLFGLIYKHAVSIDQLRKSLPPEFNAAAQVFVHISVLQSLEETHRNLLDLLLEALRNDAFNNAPEEYKSRLCKALSAAGLHFGYSDK